MSRRLSRTSRSSSPDSQSFDATASPDSTQASKSSLPSRSTGSSHPTRLPDPTRPSASRGRGSEAAREERSPASRKPSRPKTSRARHVADFGQRDLESTTYFAIAAPGLEQVVADELREASFQSVELVDGGALFTGNRREMARANLNLRCATRILVRVGEFFAPGRRELSRGVRSIDWAPWLDPRSPLAIRVTCHKSRLYHTGLVEEVIREAIGAPAPPPASDFGPSRIIHPIPTSDTLHRSASIQSADNVDGRQGGSNRKDGSPIPSTDLDGDGPTLHVRIVRDVCTLSMDSSGPLLHRRGYREELSRAPLRETLAAGLLRLADWKQDEALVDPMCGSGTIAIEAALMAMNRAPGLTRAFAFEAFPAFDRSLLEELRERARESESEVGTPILASDVDPKAVETARRNAERAGVDHLMDIRVSDVADLEPPAATGLLLTNPPYGRRIRTLRGPTEPSHRQLATALTGSFARWRRFVLGPPNVRTSLQLPIASSRPLTNGGLRVELMAIDNRSRPSSRRRRRRRPGPQRKA